MTMRHDPIDPGKTGAVEGAVFPEAQPLVADRMTRPAITIGWEEPVSRAARVMDERRIRHLPVVDADRHLIGIFTESDLREVLASEGIRDAAAAPANLIVGKAMSVEPVAVSPFSKLATAVRLMHECKVSALPVVDRGEVVGILTESDILRAYSRAIDGG